ncbi:MAG: HlyD family efflux transporter periplasmic adaptor subunit [Planctomyces sp.]|nr:HlyD family efflux transporter periplasmic adaptor subunit [Planctomyces sp.]
MPRSRIVFLIVGSVLVIAGLTQSKKLQKFFRPEADVAANSAQPPVAPIQEAKTLKMTEQARKNLGLVSRPAKPQAYWRTIEIPGEIVDRPGHSDRGVTSPAVGVVTEVHAFPGDTVKPGDRLFTLRLFSEYLQNTQAELFKATREIQLITEQHARLEGLVKTGGVPESRLIELDNQLRRQTALIQSFQQDLLTRGLNPDQIKSVTEGTFVSTIDVMAPSALEQPKDTAAIQPIAFHTKEGSGSDLAFEVQELNVELGQQVQAGQLLSTLANHQSLLIEGHAFKREASSLARAAENRWPIQCSFAEDDQADWPPFDQTLEIRHLANSVDSETRTFDFFISLRNQSRTYEKDNQTFVVWRFRPGQRVRLQVPVEELKNVLVLPSAAIVREGPEAYVFQQNGDLFNRLPVHVLHEDRLQTVVANDGSVKAGLYLAQSAAASLNRVLKSQAASGIRADVHVHADGTVHAAH